MKHAKKLLYQFFDYEGTFLDTHGILIAGKSLFLSLGPYMCILMLGVIQKIRDNMGRGRDSVTNDTWGMKGVNRNYNVIFCVNF